MTTTEQATPPPYVPAWALYSYHGVAHICYAGKLVASAPCATLAQEAHVERIFRRLDYAHAARRLTHGDESAAP